MYQSTVNGSALPSEREETEVLRAALADAQARIAELERLAETDALTPLPNRRRFLRELEHAVARAERHGTATAMLLIDLTGLKPLNEKHGHLAGDAALIHAARLLASLVRTTDHLARIEGDKFGLILDHLDHNSAIETAERIGRCLAETPVDLDGKRIPLAASIGIATILPGDGVEDVLARAHRNVKLAKLDG